MKIKILFILIFFLMGCTKEVEKDFQISFSKSTAISNAIELASPGVVGIYTSQEIIKLYKFKTRRGNVKTFARPWNTIKSNGSGFIISKDGYILTNAHNVRENLMRREDLMVNDTSVTVVVPGGEAYSASIVGLDQISDIALLKIDGENFNYCNLGDSDEVKVGEWAIALGNPRNLISNAQYQPIASAGIISAINADFSVDLMTGTLLDNMIQTDASLNLGNSGGPLIDSNGDVIGINTFIKNDSQNLGFAIPINFAKKIANELKLKGAIDRRFSYGFNARQYLYGNEKDQIGLFIDKVDYNGTAINEELFRGDIIVAVEGYKIESFEEIEIVLIKLDVRSGDEIKLTVLREDSFKNVKMTLGEI